MKKLFRIQQGILAFCLSLLLMGWWHAAQSAELNITIMGRNVLYQLRNNGRSNNPMRWKEGTGALLTAATLRDHLITLGPNCLRELGRLILAQGNPVHNIAENHDITYMDNQDAQDDLPRALPNLIDHLLTMGIWAIIPVLEPLVKLVRIAICS